MKIEKKYSKPKIDIIRLNFGDVISSSCPGRDECTTIKSEQFSSFMFEGNNNE